ncbi:MAG: hypothetical protein PHI27_09540 [Eubacteriales bacterium]|nr:hypothetical protein [Eubacteriales bacterium]MDD3882484.1 hypothetical protein [Eubacteriales bacterium]MDD4513206.1 hypothetical protein [Eubacteriales bacterium]
MKHPKLTVAACLAALFLLLYTCVVIANNRISHELERRLKACPLPEQTELIDSASFAGKMEGNGNGMQWFGVLLINSKLDRDELLDYYSAALSPEDGCLLRVSRQETPYIFDGANVKFDGFTDGISAYQVNLSKDSAVGTETSFWEWLLNSDLRGH